MKTLITQKLTAELMNKSVSTIHRYIKTGTLMANAQGKVYVSSLPTEIQDKLFALPSHPTHKTSDMHMYKVKIKFASSTDELHEVVNEIISILAIFLMYCCQLTRTAWVAISYRYRGTLYRVIADTDSRELYEKYKGYITEFDKINMMSSGFYHEELEEEFCQQVYQSVKDGTFLSATTPTWMMQKLNALAVSGRSLTLDTLEILGYEISRVSSEAESQQDSVDDLFLWYLKEKIS